MENRLTGVEVVRVPQNFTAADFQVFIEQWNKDHPEKYNDSSYMPLFSPFIHEAELVKSSNVDEEDDLLRVIMLVSPDDWPTKQEVAQITMFVNSLKNNYEFLDVKVIFEVAWSDYDEEN